MKQLWTDAKPENYQILQSNIMHYFTFSTQLNTDYYYLTEHTPVLLNVPFNCSISRFYVLTLWVAMFALRGLAALMFGIISERHLRSRKPVLDQVPTPPHRKHKSVFSYNLAVSKDWFRTQSLFQHVIHNSCSVILSFSYIYSCDFSLTLFSNLFSA